MHALRETSCLLSTVQCIPTRSLSFRSMAKACLSRQSVVAEVWAWVQAGAGELSWVITEILHANLGDITGESNCAN